MSNTTDLYLTDIVLSEKIIIDAIQELSPTSAAGPDGLPSSLLVNCSQENYFRESGSTIAITCSFELVKCSQENVTKKTISGNAEVLF